MNLEEIGWKDVGCFRVARNSFQWLPLSYEYELFGSRRRGELSSPRAEVKTTQLTGHVCRFVLQCIAKFDGSGCEAARLCERNYLLLVQNEQHIHTLRHVPRNVKRPLYLRPILGPNVKCWIAVLCQIPRSLGRCKTVNIIHLATWPKRWNLLYICARWKHFPWRPFCDFSQQGFLVEEAGHMLICIDAIIVVN
jgi:hypothetical protein